MVRKSLVGQYCKNEIFGLNKDVDDCDYSILHHLMENNLLYNNEVHFWYGIYFYYFFVVEKMDDFQFVLERILIDY